MQFNHIIMKKKNAIKFFIVGMFLYLPFQSMAWGLLGHRVTAEIAETYLSAKAKIAIKKILGNESMAMTSNWADYIKSDTAYKYLYNWHFMNLNDGINSYAEMQDYLKKDSIVDSYTKLNFLIKELKKKNLPKKQQQLYLKLLIHIVGDMHQPMHFGREADYGGNKIKIMWFSEQANLHSVWDEKLIDFQQLSYTEYTKAINYVTAPEKSTWQKQPISQWIYDSYAISRKIYQDVKPDQKLSYKYNFDYLPILNQQLLKGGIHLAALLNQIFAK